MELSATSRPKGAAARKSAALPAAGPSRITQLSTPQQRADRLSLSRQALHFLEEQNRMLEEQAKKEREGKNSEGEAALDLLEGSLKELNNCQKISARIIKGDIVPPEDLRYLMEHDPQGYRLAIAMRRPKEDPEKCDSVLAEDSREGDAAAAAPAADGADAPAASGEPSGPAQ